MSDFGIEDKKQEVQKLEESVGQPEEFGAGLADAEESSKPKEKKSIFSRFPKINFFGAPPEVSLDSVIEGVKSPSLGGKAFTDNKLEKMPLSQERTDRHEKSRQEKEKEISGESNAWSTVASQIDALASGKETATPPEAKSAERPSKRRVASMFDDPIPESEEARALKNLMGEQSRRDEVRRTGFLEDVSDTRPRSRGHRQSPPRQSECPSEPEEREVRGRGSRYRPPVEVDDLPVENFVPIRGEEPRGPKGRGHRGSRYADADTHHGRGRVQEDVPHEEWSEVDAALQQADRGERTPRDSRRQRNDSYDSRRYNNHQRPERRDEPAFDREPLDEENREVALALGSIPSWDEAVDDIVSGNIHRRKANHSGRGRR